MTAVTTVDAKKTPINKNEALSIARQADEIWASKGSKLVHIDLRRSDPTDEQILAVVLGPSGNLRAPTLRVGKTLLVGFEETSYERVLCRKPGALSLK
jgi:arsenate reductase-like glutaredoxin family protein